MAFKVPKNVKLGSTPESINIHTQLGDDVWYNGMKKLCFWHTGDNSCFWFKVTFH